MTCVCIFSDCEALTKKEKKDVFQYRNEKTVDIAQEVIVDFLNKFPHYALVGHTISTMSNGYLLHTFLLYNNQDNSFYLLNIEPFGYVMQPSKITVFQIDQESIKEDK